MKTGEFLTIASKNAPSDNPLLYPTWSNNGLTLEHGEEQVRTFVSKLTKCYREPGKHQVWNLEGKTDVVITNKRVAYFCDKFVKGGGMTLTGKAISGAIAGARRAGRAGIGQVRYEWIRSIHLSDQVGLGIFKGTYLVLECSVDGTDYQVWIGIDKNEGSQWAAQVAQLVAADRLAAGDGMDPTVRSQLVEQAGGPIARQGNDTTGIASKEARFIYDLPGSASAPF